MASAKPHTDASLARCRFGRRECGAAVAVAELNASGCAARPAHRRTSTNRVDKGVQLALNGQQYAPSGAGLPYRYYVQPQLSAVWPTGGLAASNTARRRL